jgi:ATP-dependent DNA ligase
MVGAERGSPECLQVPGSWRQRSCRVQQQRLVEAVRGLGREGVIAQRKDSLCEPGKRSDAWQKLKLEKFFSVLLMKDATTRQGFRRKDSRLQVVAISQP